MADPALDPPSTRSSPPVIDKVPKPAGLLPRHTQTLVLVGLATIIVLVIALTGQPPAPATKTAPPPPKLSVEASQARIQEYRERIDEQAKRLAAEQAELAVAKRTLVESAPAAPPRVGQHMPVGEPRDGTSTPPGEGQAREDRSLFADNLALTLRQTPTGQPMSSSRASVPAKPPAEPDLLTPPPAPVSPRAPLPASLLSAAPEPSPVPASTPAPASAPAPASTPASKPSSPSAPGVHRLLEGTIIEAVLTTRLDGSQAGPVGCLVTTPVFSRDYQTVLIPPGSRLLGTATPVERIDQKRLAVTFHRLLLPNGRSVTLERIPGLNQAGDIGLQDQVNHHYASLFGATLAVGALSGLAQMNTRTGDASWPDAYRQSVSSSVAQSSLHILDRFLNRLPTVTIREGHRVKVYLTGDLDLPADDDQPVPPVVPIR